MRNNKGVTLVELLVVIVVMGIIAGFAIPAVGGIISNANRDAVLNDAIQIENAARLYCSSTTDETFCGNSTTAGTELDLVTTSAASTNFLAEYIDGITYGGTGYTTATVQWLGGEWVVELYDGEFAFGPLNPTDALRDDVTKS